MPRSECRIVRPSSIGALLLAGVLFVPRLRDYAWDHRPIYSIYLFACAFCLSFVLMPVAIRLGERLGLVDRPDALRKHHGRVTPMTGGPAIYIAFAVTMIFNFQFSIEMKAVLVGSSLLLAVGVLDDRFCLSARIRLLAQVAVALLLIAFGVRVTFVPPWLGGVWTESVITLVWLIGITNSMNFIDGMDGLASGTAIIYSVFFALIAYATRQWYMMFLAAAVAGSCAGFFPFNFRRSGPARVFLGDSGSTFLGFLLASFAILGEWGHDIIDLVVPVLIMSVLIFDMTLTTIVRIHSGEVRSFGEWLHYTGRDHFHHRLVGLGIGEKPAALLFFGVSFTFGLEATAILFSDVFTSTVILLHSILVFTILGVILVIRSANGTTVSESPLS